MDTLDRKRLWRHRLLCKCFLFRSAVSLWTGTLPKHPEVYIPICYASQASPRKTSLTGHFGQYWLWPSLVHGLFSWLLISSLTVGVGASRAVFHCPDAVPYFLSLSQHFQKVYHNSLPSRIRTLIQYKIQRLMPLPTQSLNQRLSDSLKPIAKPLSSRTKYL